MSTGSLVNTGVAAVAVIGRINIAANVRTAKNATGIRLNMFLSVLAQARSDIFWRVFPRVEQKTERRNETGAGS